jgi:hypothetical protein
MVVFYGQLRFARVASRLPLHVYHCNSNNEFDYFHDADNWHHGVTERDIHD